MLCSTISNQKLLNFSSYINGEWLSRGQCFVITNPATQEDIAQCHSATEQDADLAVTAAKRAQTAWAKTPANQRANLLLKWSRLIMDNQDDLARILTLEQGKPLGEARGEIAYGAS